MALFFGYDPGGDGANGVAQLEIDLATGRALQVSTKLAATASAALEYFSAALATSPAAGIGVDTLTEWSMGSAGWRPADRWLREKYAAVAKSVVSPNAIFGAMSLNGMSVVHALRQRDAALVVSETHPKVLYFALAGTKYDWNDSRQSMIAWLNELLGGATLGSVTDDEFDAVLSAWTCAQGVAGRWTRDLHASNAGDGIAGAPIRPAGPTNYFWP